MGLMKRNWVWVDNHQQLQKAFEAIDSSPVIGIDTEYDSFRYFREKLCLIQVKTAKKVYLLDPLANIDISSLGGSFSDPGIVKVLHAGDNDIRILSRDYGFRFRNIFDTQKAASLLDLHYLSLGAVIEHFLGKKLDKTKKLQRSQWEARPLSEEQIDYAAKDTEHLIELYRMLKEDLKKRGLEKKAEEAFEEEVASAQWTEKTLDPRGYRKIRGFNELSRSQKARLKALYELRFQKAKETNTAVFLVLSDKELIDLARAKIHSPRLLEEEVPLSPRKMRLLGPDLFEVTKK
ncbi:MAG: ribonuclease D [Syntrophobacterales bacterium]|nr:ribonuclease D [Syntrophobacterales bacterium]